MKNADIRKKALRQVIKQKEIDAKAAMASESSQKLVSKKSSDKRVVSPKRRLNPKNVWNSMEKVGKISSGDSPDEVIADSVIDFYNGINFLYGKLTEHCTARSCPVMSAGPKYEYLWADGKTIVRPLKCSAPEYADYLLTWVQNTIEDEEIFPIEKDKPYPPHFIPTMKTVFKRLFRIYAHIYYSHTEEMRELGLESDLNSAFRHFYLFIRGFDLVEQKEMLPLKHITDKILQDLLKEKKEQENIENA